MNFTKVKVVITMDNKTIIEYTIDDPSLDAAREEVVRCMTHAIWVVPTLKAVLVIPVNKVSSVKIDGVL